MAQLLIDAGVDPNPLPGLCDLYPNKALAVFLASLFRDLALVKLLIENGASVTFKAKPKDRPLSEEIIIIYLAGSYRDSYSKGLEATVKVEIT